jgi:uncharacterized membrane protein YcjF (UPF0283 family)
MDKEIMTKDTMGLDMKLDLLLNVMKESEREAEERKKAYDLELKKLDIQAKKMENRLRATYGIILGLIVIAIGIIVSFTVINASQTYVIETYSDADSYGNIKTQSGDVSIAGDNSKITNKENTK